MAKKNAPKKIRLNREARREKRNKRLMSLVLTALMVLAIGGIWAANSQSHGEDILYGDTEFKLETLPEANNNYVYTTDVNDIDMYFYSLPLQTLTINSTGNLTALLKPAQYIALSSTPSLQYASLHDLIRFELSKYSGKFVVGGVLTKNESSQLSQLTCANATIEMPVIELRESNETSILVEDNCVFINASNQQLALIRDRLLYSMVGIINE